MESPPLTTSPPKTTSPLMPPMTPPTSHPTQCFQQSASLQLASTTTTAPATYVFFCGLFVVFDWGWENMSYSFADPVGLSP
jgi:hypothetical protein